MPRHAKPDVHRPVNDNAIAPAPASKEKPKKLSLPQEHTASKSPQASGMPGSLTILKDPANGGGRGIVGVPGIISSTTTSPETRQRLVGGIIESLMKGAAPGGPVQAVEGNDSTAYNSGMSHIRGSPYTMRHK
tara:strand:+ start:1344 stop:1742 length:399 start_codon:yes stop_codon:yes gene_type:complete